MMDSVNSTTFIKRPPCISDIPEKFLYTKELLSARIFLGTYEERRYVSVLKEYRDVVVVSPEEIELLQDLEKLMKKWIDKTDVKWVGITGPDKFSSPNTYCFWIKLPNIPFGQYWFQIKHVKLLDHEIVIQLKCIRKHRSPLFSCTPSSNKEDLPEKSSSGASVSSVNASVDINVTQKAFSEIKRICTQTIIPELTFRNFVKGIKVAGAFLIVIFMGFVSVIQYLVEYSLKLIREVTLLINALTPIIIQVIDLLGKIIGGLFILIAGCFSRNKQQYNFMDNYYKNKSINGNPNIPINWRERNRILRQELLYKE